MFRRTAASVSPLIALALMALPLLAAGCAHERTRVDEAQLAELPPSARRQLLDREQQIDVARANVASAAAALDDAKQWKKRTMHDRRASAYAQDLVLLRHAQLDEAQASLRLARANVELARAQALRQHGLRPRVDSVLLLDEQRRAGDELAAARIGLAERAGAVESSRRAWARQTAQARTAPPPPSSPTLPPPTPMAVPPTPPM